MVLLLEQQVVFGRQTFRPQVVCACLCMQGALQGTRSQLKEMVAIFAIVVSTQVYM